MPRARRVCLAFILLAIASTCFSQTPATFRTVTATERASDGPYAERPSNGPYLVDLNNDGILDLIQQTPQSSSTTTFTVRIANGNGLFSAPVIYSFASSVQHTVYGIPMASGDFNGDGKVDLIFAIGPGGNQLVLFLGKGEGTLQAPKYITMALPSGQQLGASFLAADFNGDGKLDLITNTMTPNPPSGYLLGSVYLIPGDGAGNFESPTLIYTPPANYYADALHAGDFDGDGRADVEFVYGDYCADDQSCDGPLHVLYNDGDSQFTDTATGIPYGGYGVSTGDLNSDGLTDILASSAGVYVLYGQPDRTFHLYTKATEATPKTGAFAMADVNGDTRMDLVGSGQSSRPGEQFVFYLADSSEGAFTQQTYALPAHTGSDPLVGNFNSDTKPDILVVQQNTASEYVIADALNTTTTGNWGGCAYPKSGMGIHVCMPASSAASPVTFNASANSFGQLRKIELFVDGTKVAEQFHVWGPRAWFDFSGTLPPGPHRGVIIAADIDNRLQQTVFNFTVGMAACSAPVSPGVMICAPTSGVSVASPVQVQATATVTGTIASMQLWVDGVKKFTVASNTLSTSISLAAGTHRFAVLATNTAGQKWESAVNATVK